MDQASPLPVRPSAWTEILEKVEGALEQAQEQAAQREQALMIGAQPPESEADQEAARRRHMGRIEEHWQRLQSIVREAELAAAEADDPLGFEEEMLRRWLDATAAVKARLADGAGRRIR
jgi:hypothetical protein